MIAKVLILLACLVAVGLAENTNINFNFEGMIPAQTCGGSGGSSGSDLHVEFTEYLNNDLGNYNELGGSYVFANELSGSNGKNGTSSGVCILVALPDVGVCNWALIFSDEDTIHLQQVSATSGAVAVIGGTGEYKHISGQCYYTDVASVTGHYECDFHLP